MFPRSRSRPSACAPLIVARMKADGRLVQDIQYSGKTRTDLGCQANALGLTAGERCRPRQREIVEADVYQELEAAHDFADHLARDLPDGIGQLEVLEEGERVAERLARNFSEREAVEASSRGIGPDACAPARRAGHLIHEVIESMAVDPRHSRGFINRRVEALVLERSSMP